MCVPSVFSCQNDTPEIPDQNRSLSMQRSTRILTTLADKAHKETLAQAQLQVSDMQHQEFERKHPSRTCWPLRSWRGSCEHMFLAARDVRDAATASVSPPILSQHSTIPVVTRQTHKRLEPTAPTCNSDLTPQQAETGLRKDMVQPPLHCLQPAAGSRYSYTATGRILPACARTWSE